MLAICTFLCRLCMSEIVIDIHTDLFILQLFWNRARSRDELIERWNCYGIPSVSNELHEQNDRPVVVRKMLL